MSTYKPAENAVPHYTGTDFANIQKSDGGLLHAVGASSYQVLRANRERPELAEGTGFTYNHAPDMTLWNGRFYVQYISNRIDEHEPGGISLISSSADGVHWSSPAVSFPPLLLPHGENRCADGKTVIIPENTYAVMHQRTAFYIAPNGKLLTTGFYGYSPDHAVPWENNGMGRVVREIYPDGSFGEIFFIHVLTSSGWDASRLPFETYDKSKDTGFVVACEALLADKFETQQWAEEHGNNDALVSLKTRNEAFGFSVNKPYQAFARYHIDEKTVVALWKQAVVGVSRDGGETWEIKRETSFATSGAKAWGQKTGDGHFAIAYLNSLSSEHRYPLVAVTSDNGLDFDNMACLFGETPPRRYDGLFKDFGPQYVRGISEICPERPTDALWLCFSVNKEDIWVSRVPVPIKTMSEKHADGAFSGAPFFEGWNIYSGKLASVENTGGAMLITDADPVDYALAEYNFPCSARAKAIIELECDNYAKKLEIELADENGNVCARVLIGGGRLSSRYTSVENTLAPFTGKHVITIEQDCLTCDYTVSLDGKRLSTLRNMQKVNTVSRFIIRTKPRRFAPGIEKRPITPDLPNASEPQEPRVYRIYSVKTESV